MKYESLYSNLLKEFENDPQYQTESALIDLTEYLCRISQSRKTYIIVWIIERLAGLVIRNRTPLG